MTSILQLADVHFGVEDREAVEAVLALEAELAPDLVLLCGDVTQTGATDEYEAAESWIKRLRSPLLATPGNHDAPYVNVIERVAAPYKRFEEHVGRHSLDMYLDERVCILPYNSSRAIQAKLDWSVGAVNLDELDALIARFKREAPGRLHFLACHHPLVYPPESPLDKETDNGPEALERLSDANCDAVLTGHIHIPFVKDREPGETGLLSIGAGTLSTRRRGVDSSLNHIEVDGDGLRVTAVDFTDGSFSRRATWKKAMSAFA